MFEEQFLQAVLLLEDGLVMKGKGAGLKGVTTGEICFNTGMTGYQEIFTDPSYFGQIMVTTNAHIGNYGAHPDEVESEKMQIAGLICKNFTTEYSRLQADRDIDRFFKDHQTVCIYGVDTRKLVRHIRQKGAMNAIISNDGTSIDEMTKILNSVPSMSGLELASKVTVDQPYTLGNESAPYRVAVYDYGIKRNILKCMVDRGCFVKVFPAKTKAEDLFEFKPNGFFLSNGPGDPAAMSYAVESIKKLQSSGKPIFGICLGHQLLALAQGIPTYKMHHGHRGINHPVKNIITGKSEITSQNHGFGVAMEALENLKSHVEITHLNLNDDTVEGIRLKDYPAFSVQYHPESSPGPHDSRYLFDQFVDLLNKHKN
ncbi:MAG TPA: glutamine-hydrolyzing carbamoyl-phosphate synthase small subunit [Saprospiraceae bacterium]|nr:glutamine-hydrolyzing carbamoyl-phosphate synthase small subunit [Saprospiraceae bacterium]